jgi:hypothetical protein
MAMIARPTLAAAVCEAGGLGTIGSDINPPAVVARRLTTFGPPGLLPLLTPVDPYLTQGGTHRQREWAIGQRFIVRS